MMKAVVKPVWVWVVLSGVAACGDEPVNSLDLAPGAECVEGCSVVEPAMCDAERRACRADCIDLFGRCLDDVQAGRAPSYDACVADTSTCRADCDAAWLDCLPPDTGSATDPSDDPSDGETPPSARQAG